MSRFSIRLRTGQNSIFALPELEVRSPDIPEAFDGFTFVQLTDLHLGKATPLNHIKHALELVAARSPDLLVLTGDLVQVNRLGWDDRFCKVFGPKLSGYDRSRRRAKELAHQVSELLAATRPPEGIVGVFGNHDYHEGIDELLAELPHDITWLKNSSHEIRRGKDHLIIYGVDDLWRGDPDLGGTISSRAGNDSFLRLLLSHNPDIVISEDAHLLEEIDLVLCGHTHGGQICLPVVGPLTTRTEQTEHVRGLSWFKKTAVFTSSGTGYGLIRLRIGCPPEVVSTKLIRETAA